MTEGQSDASAYEDRLVAGSGSIRALTVIEDPDGRTILVSAGDDGTIRQWAAATGEPYRPPLRAEDTRYVWALTAGRMADGPNMLISGDISGHVHRWDAGTGRQLGEALQGGDDGIDVLVAWTGRDGHVMLASAPASDRGPIRRWDATTGSAFGQPLSRDGEHVTSMAVWRGPDGRATLAAADRGGTILCWPADVPAPEAVRLPRGRRIGVSRRIGDARELTVWTSADGHMMLAAVAGPRAESIGGTSRRIPERPLLGAG
jgi:WD40 repeat protein